MSLTVSSRRAVASRRRNTLLLTLAALAGAAAIVQIQSRRAQRANPPQGQFLDVDGVRLHYVEHGSGPALVLLHGNGTMIRDFELSGLIDAASATHRVIVFDRPGFGWSARPRTRIWAPVAQAHLLQQALVQLGVKSATVVGHSWGTLVALALALEHPQQVARLVLLSGYYYPTLRLDVPLFSPPAIPIIGDVLRYSVSPLVGRLIWPGLLRMLFGPQRVPARFDAFPTWMALRPSQLRAGAAESAMMVPAAMTLQKRYRELSMPVTIVAGTGDRVASATHQSARLHRDLPGSELRLVPEMGHMIHHLALGEVMAAIDSTAATGGQQAAEASAGTAATEASL
jgi:pimeloyl-ACP methyl ester carboxylesterase